MKDKVSFPRLSSTVRVGFPDFSDLPEDVRQKFESLPTKLNLFRMLGHSPGAFVELMDLTDAIFKKLTLSDYHKELLVMLVAAYEDSTYEWEQHISISRAAGVREDQILAIAKRKVGDENVFSEGERILLHFGECILERGKVPGVVVNQALQFFSTTELSDAMIVIGFYRMLSGYIRTFNLPSDPQQDGDWIKE